MSCKCAVRTDQYHGWMCTITDGECLFYFPDSKLCAEEYDEGPDSISNMNSEDGIADKYDEIHERNIIHEDGINDDDVNWEYNEICERNMTYDEESYEDEIDEEE